MKNKVLIIVPFREREHHLTIFAPSVVDYLEKNNTEGEILIVEQEKGKPFNRAKLLNVGFDYAEKMTPNKYSHFCFHDVDMIPLETDYNFCENPTHLASRAEQFNYKLPYENYFGGVTIFDRESFLKVNGYSNEYWGWGAEDDDMFYRCKTLNIPRLRKDGMYKSLAHNREIPQELYSKNVETLRAMMRNFDGEKFNEGLSTLEYSVTDEKQHELYKQIKVEI